MKKIAARTLLLMALLLMPAMLKAQYVITDSIIPRRIVVKSTSHGIAILDNLDTYLSGYSFLGAGYKLSHENFRDALMGKRKWKYQTLFNATLGLAIQEINVQYTLLADYSWGGYHSFEINDRLQLLAGGQAQLSGGVLYLTANGNNPASVKIRAAIAASAMAIYHIPIKGRDHILRLQLDIPLSGVMFTPQYGQSYYEIFGRGDTKGIIKFSYPGNTPSWRHTLSFDIPVGSKYRNNTLRLSYNGDFYQSRINGLRTHIYNNSISIGVVRTLYKIKEGDPIKAYSPY